MLIKLDRSGITAIPQGQFAHIEKHLESIVEKAPSAFLGMDILLIGRQVHTDRGIVDLLGLDNNGNTVIIELKRNESPREIVSQAISYRTHFRLNGNLEHLNRIAEDYFGQSSDEGLLVKKKFKEKFGSFPTNLNTKQIVVLIAEHFSDEVLNDLEEVADHTCIKFSYFKSTTGEEYFAAEKVSGSDIALTQDSKRASSLREFDIFFEQVVQNVKKLLPQHLTTFKNTNAHAPREQWIRFHWGGRDTHVGLWAGKDPTGDQISVYFCNWRREPTIIQSLESNSGELHKALGLNNETDIYDSSKKTSIDKGLGVLTKENQKAMVEKATQTVATFISTLKPMLGDML